MIYPSQAIQIRPDLIEYRELCSKYGYQPNKEEYEDILKFLLLFQTGIGHTCESHEVDFFYNEMEMHLLENNLNESLIEMDFLNEAGGEGAFADPAKEKDTALGLITAAGVGAAGLGAAAAVGVGMFISYLMKKGKVKSAVKAELASMMKKLEPFQLIYKKSEELANLKGETFDGIGKLPSVSVAPPMEEKKEK
jgi:hypothetical protein